MPASRKPSLDSTLLVARVSLFLAAAAALYYVTWGFLIVIGRARWLAAAWVAETYLLMAGVYVFRIWQPARRRRVERRKLPRVPMAMPMRYATEDGQVGIGVLVDAHETGAGLLLPRGAFDADRVWMQSVWFDDRVGIQGKVIYVKETPDGLRLGLQLQGLHPESVDFFSSFVSPLGQRRFIRNGRSRISLLNPLVGRGGRWEHLPVQVEQGSLKVWAITEDMSETGAVLLLPQALRETAPLTIGVWGSPQAQECRVVLSETLRLPRLTIHRVMVQYMGVAPVPANQTVADAPAVSLPALGRSRTTRLEPQPTGFLNRQGDEACRRFSDHLARRVAQAAGGRVDAPSRPGDALYAQAGAGGDRLEEPELQVGGHRDGPVSGVDGPPHGVVQQCTDDAPMEEPVEPLKGCRGRRLSANADAGAVGSNQPVEPQAEPVRIALAADQAVAQRRRQRSRFKGQVPRGKSGSLHASYFWPASPALLSGVL